MTDQVSRHIYQAAECLMSTSESVAAMFTELSRILREPDDEGAPLILMDSYGYTSNQLSSPKYWIKSYQGCLFIPRADTADVEAPLQKKLRENDIIALVVVQFYDKRIIQQAEVWFGIGRLRQKCREWFSPVYAFTPQYMSYWAPRELPDYGQWQHTVIRRSDNPNLELEWSRRPLGHFTDRDKIVNHLVEPLRQCLGRQETPPAKSETKL